MERILYKGNYIPNYTNFTSEYGVKIIEPIRKYSNGSYIWKCIYECGNYFESIPSKVINGSRKHCGCKTRKNSSLSKTKITFGCWCDINNRSLLEMWNYELNKCSPYDVPYKTTKVFYFNCIKNRDHSPTKISLSHLVDRGISCKECNSFLNWFNNSNIGNIEDYWDYELNKIRPNEISSGSGRKVYIKCNRKSYHGSYQVSCNKFKSGRRCPMCNRNSGLLHEMDSLGYAHKEVLDIWSSINMESPYQKKPNSAEMIWLKCKDGIHDDYQTSVCNAVSHNFRCPKCSNSSIVSFLHLKVLDFLDANGYEYLREDKCNISPINPKTGRMLKYDIEIPSLKVIIEVNDIQHYKRDNGWYRSEEEFNDSIFRDNFKMEYAISKGYTYIVIPYTMEENDEYINFLNNKLIKLT